MTDSRLGLPRHDRLIGELVGDLAPVKRVASPLRSLAVWGGVLALMAVVVAIPVDLANVQSRLASAPDMWLAAAGSLATAVLAALAAFQLSLPDRDDRWALLPLPALAVWLGASGLGCLRSWLIPGVPVIPLDHIKQCFFFIAGFSIPLSALLALQLRRGYTLRPTLDAALAGLAAAAAAATLLVLVHPFEATALDLTVHFVTVALVVAVNRALGGRFLRQQRPAHP